MVDQATIVAGLADLDVVPTASVMVHASLSAFGHVKGGAATVVSALREAAGPDGAVLIPSFRDAIRSEHYALRACEAVCPQPLCPSRECGYTGKIGETLRGEPDAVRSCHPTHSWVGVGGGASWLLEGHRDSPTPCGRDSPFLRLLERDGQVLLLGVGVNALTNIHAVEDARDVAYLSAVDPPRRHATYTTSGRRIQYRFPHMLHEALVHGGILRTRRIGDADCHQLSARRFAAWLWVATESDPWCLVLRPRGERYDPAEDARLKTAAMAEAWAAGPDGEAWRRLLAASARQPAAPTAFAPCYAPRTDCPAYRGLVRGLHRCAANDVPPWESFDPAAPEAPGATTCGQCNWPATRPCGSSA
jgi:aminoglycoside 3-N-acetyltransferase